MRASSPACVIVPFGVTRSRSWIWIPSQLLQPPSAESSSTLEPAIPFKEHGRRMDFLPAAMESVGSPDLPRSAVPATMVSRAKPQ